MWIQKGTYHVLKYPVVPGADGAGVVTAVGDAVDRTLIGREVIINPRLSWGENEGPIYRKQISILGTKMGSPRDFAAIVQMVESKAIQPIVDRTLPLSCANEAYRIVDRGEQFGKVVLINDLRG